MLNISNGQFMIFLIFVCFGIFFSLLLKLINLGWGKCNKKNIAFLSLFDFIFCFLFGFCFYFIVSYINYGVVRWFHFLGIIMGFLAVNLIIKRKNKEF